MTEQVMRQWGYLFAWTVPLILILGMLAMAMMLALMVAWRHSVQRWRRSSYNAWHRAHGLAYMDTWAASVRQQGHGEDDPHQTDHRVSHPTEPTFGPTSEDEADAPPWHWEPEPQFGEADDDAPWRDSLDDAPDLWDDVDDEDDEDGRANPPF